MRHKYILSLLYLTILVEIDLVETIVETPDVSVIVGI